MLNYCFPRIYASKGCFPRPARQWGAEVEMLIEIHELEKHPIDFKEELQPGILDLGSELRQKAALLASGRAQLVEEHHGKQGLCPHCGKNLNVESCSCAEPVEDPRWSALKDIREKLEH
jgi:hypothetical protein